MDEATQQNAAGPEESASSAEELRVQARSVKVQVDEFLAVARGNKWRDTSPGDPPAAAARPPQPAGQPANESWTDVPAASDSHDLSEF